MTAVDTTQIAERAYHFWEQEGRPDGKALAHWLQAETELAAAPTSQPTTANPTQSSPKQAPSGTNANARAA